MFSNESMPAMTMRNYAAEATCMAGDARARVFRPYSASPAASVWSPISLGANTQKHGRPRRTEVSHP
jgi:hypothetical protein